MAQKQAWIVTWCEYRSYDGGARHIAFVTTGLLGSHPLQEINRPVQEDMIRPSGLAYRTRALIGFWPTTVKHAAEAYQRPTEVSHRVN